MNHEDVKLESVSKLFEFEKISREIDSCDDIESLKNISKCYAKLYFGLEEFIQKINLV